MLRRAGSAGRSVTLLLRFEDFTVAGRSRTLAVATADARTIGATAAALPRGSLVAG